MAASDMKELLKHELGDLLYAEQLIVKMLGTLTREVKNPEVLNRVQEHIGETEEQIERLQRAFEQIGEKAKPEKCAAAIGLKEEHDSFKKEEKPSKALLEAFDLGNSLRVEHYEIAGYRSAIAVATAMGEREVVALLSESLREEEQMASFFERNAVKALKGLAAGMDLAAGNAEVVLTADGGGSSRSRSSGSRSSASKSSGSKSSGSKSSSASRSASSKSNGRSTTGDTGSRSSGSRSSSSGSKSSGSSRRSSASKSGGSKSSGSSSSSRSSSAGSSSRTTADRSSSGGSSSRSSGSKSNGSSARSSSSKSSGGSTSSRSSSSKSGGGSSKSGGSKSGSSSSRSRGGSGGSARA